MIQNPSQRGSVDSNYTARLWRKEGDERGQADAEERTEKVGIPRVIEALQANDWASLPTEHDDDDALDAELDAESDLGLEFGEPGDFEGLRQAILEASLEREGVDPEDSREGGEGAAAENGSKDKKGEEEDLGEEDVRRVESMMSKLMAVREMGEGMPEAERRRMARRAVGEVMRDL